MCVCVCVCVCERERERYEGERETRHRERGGGGKYSRTRMAAKVVRGVQPYEKGSVAKDHLSCGVVE